MGDHRRLSMPNEVLTTIVSSTRTVRVLLRASNEIVTYSSVGLEIYPAMTSTSNAAGTLDTRVILAQGFLTARIRM